MRQGNGADLLGANDPRSSTIGVIHVAPNDDRESVLAAILTQEKLGRKQIVIELPEQNKAFQRPVDFDGLKNMRRKLQASLVIVAPPGPGPADFARQRRFPVFSSLDNYKEWLNENGSSLPGGRKGSMPPVRRGLFGSRSRPPSSQGVNSSEATPSADNEQGQGDQQSEHNTQQDDQNVAALGIAGIAGLAGADMAMQAHTNGQKPPVTDDDDDFAISDSSANGNRISRRNTQGLPPMQPPPPTPVLHDDDVDEHDEEKEPPTLVFPVNATAFQDAPQPVSPPSSVPEDDDFDDEAANTPVPLRRRSNTGKMAAAGAAGALAGAGMTSRTTRATGGLPRRGTTGKMAAGAGAAAGASAIPARRPAKKRRLGLLPLALVVLLLASVVACVSIAFAAPGVLTPLTNVVPKNLRSLVPGATGATVTITPKSRDEKNAYIIGAVTGNPNTAQRQVQARLLSYTTPDQSKTVNATGVKQTAGVRASGTLTFLNGSSQAETVSAGTVLRNRDGISVITDAPAFISAASPPNFGTGTVSAHAVNPGTSGNIGAGTLYQTCCFSGNFVTVNNPSAFSGGQDPQNYTFVQQSDIDGAAKPLEDAMPQSALTALKSKVQPGEQFVGQPQCSPKVSSNQNAGDKASSVTVTVSATCTAEVYDLAGAQKIVSDLLKAQATHDLGSDYALVTSNGSGIATTISQPTVVDDKGTLSMQAKAEGMWAYQFDDAKKSSLARAIAGKKKTDASAILTQSTGVAQVDNIDVAGGDTLPTDVNQITIVVQSVSGVQAGATPPAGSGTPSAPGNTPAPNSTPQPGLGGS